MIVYTHERANTHTHAHIHIKIQTHMLVYKHERVHTHTCFNTHTLAWVRRHIGLHPHRAKLTEIHKVYLPYLMLAALLVVSFPGLAIPVLDKEMMRFEP